MKVVMANVPDGPPKPLPVESVASAYVRAIARRQRRLLFDRASFVAVYFPKLANAIGERVLSRRPARAVSA